MFSEAQSQDQAAMKYSARIILSLAFANSISAGSGSALPLDPKKAHLDFDLSKGVAELKFYSAKDFSATPEIILNDQGLWVNGKIVCSWPGGKFSSKDSYKMVLGPVSSQKSSDADACRKGGSILSTWGDGGSGTAVLYIELDHLTGDLAEVSYKQSKVFLNLKPLRGRFSVRKPGELTNHPGE